MGSGARLFALEMAFRLAYCAETTIGSMAFIMNWIFKCCWIALSHGVTLFKIYNIVTVSRDHFLRYISSGLSVAGLA